MKIELGINVGEEAGQASCFRSCLLVLFSCVGGLLLLTLTGLYFAAGWLHVDNKPEQADAALVLAGGYYRALYAADLYQQGYVKHIYISRAVVGDDQLLLERLGISNMRQENVYQRILLHQGVPPAAISILGASAISTYEEAVNTQQLLSGKIDKLLVVTSPFHARRAQIIFSDVMKGMQVIVVSTPYEVFSERWWENQNVSRNVVLELMKIPFYLFGGQFISSSSE